MGKLSKLKKKYIEEESEVPQGHDSNALSLPAKRKCGEKSANKKKEQPKKGLSKKKRKRLELVLARRVKKANRSSVLSQLDELPQISHENFSSVTTLSQRKAVIKKEIVPTCGNIHPEENDINSSDSSSDVDTDEENQNAGEDDANEQTFSEQWLMGGLSEQVKGENIDIGESNEKSNIEDEDDDIASFPTGDEMVHGLKRIQVERSSHINGLRNSLPIKYNEDLILEAVATNPVCIICGSTGSGKTTQVPQFLYEAGYASQSMGIIGVTEPRRVAAISMSKRVAEELNLPTSVVSYKIRYEGNCTKDTKIKFMTDGVLLREVQEDFLLLKYSVIILDEAHERSEFTDLLIGFLSRIVPLRKKRDLRPLKLVIMSATLRTEDFANNRLLFKKAPPIIDIEVRQFALSVHFQKRTPPDGEHVKEAFQKICKIHRNLPKGAILVFVTGKDEINLLLKWLQQTFPRTRRPDSKSTEIEAGIEQKPKRLKLDNFESKSTATCDEEKKDEELEESVGQPSTVVSDSTFSQAKLDQDNPLYTLPLHSLLSSEDQALVFQPPPPGSRLCVVATNVAETSLTIPNTTYVVDSGKEKRKVYDVRTGVSTFIKDWISKSSADQRAGRAGRQSNGHCYRLYSSAVFNEFVEYSRPEVLMRPIDDLVLLLKSFGLTRVERFPFPNAPSSEAILAAETHLYHLGALTKAQAKATGKYIYAINDLGRTMMNFGVAPRFAKMLALSNNKQSTGCFNALPYVIALVSAFTVRELFVVSSQQLLEAASQGDGDEEEDVEKRKQKKKAHNKLVRETFQNWQSSSTSPHTRKLGDVGVLLNAMIEYDCAGGSVVWCKRHGLRVKAMQEITKLRRQLTHTVNMFLPPDAQLNTANLQLTHLKHVSEIDTLRQILLSGLGDLKVAKRLYSDEYVASLEKKRRLGVESEEDGKKFKDRKAYQAVGIETVLYIHPHSVLANELPEYIAFQEMHGSAKMYAKDCIVIEDNWLPHFFHTLAKFSDPLEDPAPFYDPETGVIKCHMTCSYANNAWPIKAQQFQYPITLNYYKLFAMFLLDGEIIDFFKQYKSQLLAQTSIMMKPWAKLQPRTQSILNALIEKECTSKQKLKEIWKEDRNYLLKEYLEWLPVDCIFPVQSKWPPEQDHQN